MAVREKQVGRDVPGRVRGTLLRYGMVTGGETLVVGVSGGLDSVTLLDILAGLREEFRLRFVVAHVHHGLRDEEGAKLPA